jgi:hypothetical protein
MRRRITGNKNKKSLIALSREVVQTAEDAREIAVGTSTKKMLKRLAATRPRSHFENRAKRGAEARRSHDR